MNKMRPCTVGIIGGGPVALYTAQLLQRQGFDVHVFEKRSSYTRKRIVSIDSQYWDGESRVALCDLENQWSIGLTIHHNEVLDGLQNDDTYDLVIVCDGAKSANRKFVCDEEPLIVKHLQRLVIVDVTGVVPEPYTKRLYYMLKANVLHLTNRDSVSIILPPDKTSQEVIKNVCRARHLSSPLDHHITILPLAATRATRLTNDHHVLLGDTACGLPFRKGLNAGLACSTNLCHQLVAHSSVTTALQHYDTWASEYLHKACTTAAITSFLVDLRRTVHTGMIACVGGLFQHMSYFTFLFFFWGLVIVVLVAIVMMTRRYNRCTQVA
jgi:2-polyprenyl-6-methoxyphenol hydroxylase-like FAD-dependent oxidoreductase